MNALVALLLATALSANVAKVESQYDRAESQRLVPMLSEVLRFPTVAGADQARRDQQAWLPRTAKDLGFAARDAGPGTEHDPPATTPNAPSPGPVVPRDVQPVIAH